MSQNPFDKQLAKLTDLLPAQLLARVEFYSDTMFPAELVKMIRDVERQRNIKAQVQQYGWATEAAEPARPSYRSLTVQDLESMRSALTVQTQEEFDGEVNQKILDLFPPDEYTFTYLLTHRPAGH